MYPADALNSAAANALLKMLEEPPPSTIFILVTDSLDRLLPTILSRCRKFALPMPAKAEALQWLQQQGVKESDARLAEAGGAPLAAQASAMSEDSDSVSLFINELIRPSSATALKAAEALQKTPVVGLVTVMQRWLYDLFSVKLASETRYYPRYRKELDLLAARIDAAALMKATKSMNERRAIAEHPLSPKLFIEDMLLDYSALFVK
jgi:DNA polymerase-3 subunit delta'